MTYEEARKRSNTLFDLLTKGAITLTDFRLAHKCPYCDTRDFELGDCRNCGAPE